MKIMEKDNDCLELKLGRKTELSSTPEQIWASEVEYMIENADNKIDLNAIGAKLQYAIDNNLYGDLIWGYQLKAAKKMTEIYNKPKLKEWVA
jgi:hypothetical protein